MTKRIGLISKNNLLDHAEFLDGRYIIYIEAFSKKQNKWKKDKGIEAYNFQFRIADDSIINQTQSGKKWGSSKFKIGYENSAVPSDIVDLIEDCEISITDGEVMWYNLEGQHLSVDIKKGVFVNDNGRKINYFMFKNWKKTDFSELKEDQADFSDDE